MYVNNQHIATTPQIILNAIGLFFTLSVTTMITWRYWLYKKSKNIGYLIKLRNSIYDDKRLLIFLIIEIIIHIIQPYPQIDIDWIINTLGIDVKYNLNSIFTSFTVIRMYVWLRIAKYFNMYYGEEIKAISHINISSIYMFLYRSNVRYRPFLTIFIVMVFSFFIWTILFICYERYDSNGIFSYTWNVIWIIVVTMTTSKCY
jgi:hypothetical protein